MSTNCIERRKDKKAGNDPFYKQDLMFVDWAK